MNAKKGIYHNGVVELIEKPETQETSEVLVVFPEKKKGISKIGGLFRNIDINYDEIEEELKKLSKCTASDGNGISLIEISYI